MVLQTLDSLGPLHGYTIAARLENWGERTSSSGLLGLWLARLAVQALIRAYPTSVPRMSEIAIDLSVLLFLRSVCQWRRACSSA